MRYLAATLLLCSITTMTTSAIAEEATAEATETAGALPEITIVRRHGGTLDEYRINDRIFMVKMTPTKGKAYYLVDTDGDGKLNTRYNAMDDGLVIPSWVLQ